MPDIHDDLGPVSSSAGRGGGRAALAYGLIGVVTVLVVHATLDREGPPAAEGAVARPAAAAVSALSPEPPAGLADESRSQASYPPVVSASPRRTVAVQVRDALAWVLDSAPSPAPATPATAEPAAPNPLLARSQPLRAEVTLRAVAQAASAPAVLTLPASGPAGRVSPLGPHLAHGRLYGAPGGSRIVYLIDASGSQVDTLPFVQQALQRAVRSLRSEQSFAVMFFNSDAITEAGPTGLTPATADAVTQADRFIDPQAGRVVARGRAEARGAIRRALAYRPDTVVLLSDGLTGRRTPLADRADLLALIDTANASGARFHTIQVRQPDPLATAQRRGTLELIAARTGGAYRFVTDAELPVR